MDPVVFSAMILAGAASGAPMAFQFKAAPKIHGVTVTAADVVHADVRWNSTQQAKLSQIKLRTVSGCPEEIVLKKVEVARRILNRLPGIFRIEPGETPEPSLRVKVVTQIVDPARLQSAIEDFKPAACPLEFDRISDCRAKVIAPIVPLCVPGGNVDFVAEIGRSMNRGDKGYVANLSVMVDGERSAMVRIPVELSGSRQVWQLTTAVQRGQAIRKADVALIHAGFTPADKSKFDALTGVIRAAEDLQAGETIRSELVSSLAVGRVDDVVQVRSVHGLVDIQRNATLASDAAEGRTSFVQLSNGQVIAARPQSETFWEVIQ